jgi:hypothetical protein
MRRENGDVCLVIAGAAKQSRVERRALDCSVALLLAMTNREKRSQKCMSVVIAAREMTAEIVAGDATLSLMRPLQRSGQHG